MRTIQEKDVVAAYFKYQWDMYVTRIAPTEIVKALEGRSFTTRHAVQLMDGKFYPVVAAMPTTIFLDGTGECASHIETWVNIEDEGFDTLEQVMVWWEVQSCK